MADRRRNKKKRTRRKPGDIRMLYGYKDEHWRIWAFCRTKNIRDRKLKELRAKYPDHEFKEINPIKDYRNINYFN